MNDSSEPVEESDPASSQPPRTDPWRVVLVDDHAMFRAGVRHEIGDVPPDGEGFLGVRIVAEGEDVATAVQAVVEAQPDVVLLDVHLPGGGGPEVIKQVGSRAPDTRFLALSVSDAAES